MIGLAEPKLLGKGGGAADVRLSSPTRSARDEQSLAKANEAIAIRPKRGKLTLLSRRIYNVFLFHAQQQGVDNPGYSILLSELIADARFTSHNTELLKAHIRDMQATTIEWHTSTGGIRKWTSTQLLGTVVIDEPGRGRPCTISWSYPDAIREYLVRPAQYTRILLEISSQMRSYAASVLYELGARYLTSPGRLTMREDVIWWASVLTGRSDITTVDYRILHRDTIKKALAELDALCVDFRLEVVEHRRGRKVEELQFRVLPKPQSTPGGGIASGNVLDLALVERVMEMGFGRAAAQDLYAGTDEAVLRSALDHVEKRMKSASLPPLQSTAAYLRDALKKQYVRADEESVKPAKMLSRQLGSRERLQRLRDEWDHHQANQARSLFREMTEEQTRHWFARFETEKVPDMARPIAKAWHRDGVESRIAGSAFFQWLAHQLWPVEATAEELLEFAVSRP